MFFGLHRGLDASEDWETVANFPLDVMAPVCKSAY